MGIIYKLKKDVIDFILQKKNENRALSCRQISVIVSEKFKTQVSKSSVNTVIKNARLSSSVGRKVQEDGRPKKFQIPPVKKKQLSDNLKNAGFESAPFERSVPVEKEKVLTGRTDAGEKSGKEVVISSSTEARPKDASYEKFLECVHRWRETVREQKGPLLDGMGFVFLKSVEWGISGTSILGKVLKRHLKNQPSARFERSCEMLPYLGMLGVSSKEDIECLKNHALWTLANGSDQSETCSMLDWTKETKLSSTLLMEYVNEIDQALFNVHRFAVYLEDGKCVYMDAQLASLWKDKPPDPLYSSLNRSISRLSRSFISNNDPAIFFALGDGSLPLEEVVEMMTACDPTGKNAVKKIVALDGKDSPVIEFSSIPLRKRSFSVGIWPWQKGFSEFAKYIYWDEYKPFYSKQLNIIFHFKELRANAIFKSPELYENIRVIAVLDQHTNKPVVVILTNHTKMSAEDLAQAFILRWPNLDQGPAGSIFQKVDFMQYVDNNNVVNVSDPWSEHGTGISVEKTILSLSNDFGQVLQRYCREQFSLDPTSLHIDGYCMCMDNVRCIILNLAPDHPRLREIKRAVLAINESAITDFDGYLLLVQYDVKKNPEGP